MNSSGKIHHWDSTKFCFSTWCSTNCVEIVHAGFQSISDTLSRLFRIEASEGDRKELHGLNQVMSMRYLDITGVARSISRSRNSISGTVRWSRGRRKVC